MGSEQSIRDQVGKMLQVLGTPDTKWYVFRANAAQDGEDKYDLAGTDLDWATIIGDNNVRSTDGIINILDTLGPGINAAEIAFFTDATDAATDTFAFEIFAWRSGPNGPGVRVFSTTGAACIIGTQDCVKHPVSGAAQSAGLWCHTISGTDHWDGCSVIDSGNNRIARLIIDDLRGYKFLLIRVFNADGSGTECGRVGAVISGY